MIQLQQHNGTSKISQIVLLVSSKIIYVLAYGVVLYFQLNVMNYIYLHTYMFPYIHHHYYKREWSSTKTDFYISFPMHICSLKNQHSEKLLTNAICLDVSQLFALENKNQRWETVRGHQKPIEAKRQWNQQCRKNVTSPYVWTSKQVFPNLCYATVRNNP